MIYIGIDPGNCGALAYIDTERNDIRVKDMPIFKIEKSTKTKKGNTAFKTEIDKNGVLYLLEHFKPFQKVHIFMEKVGVMPGEGSVGAFSFGRGVGILEGIIAALGFPVTYVPPQTWKKVMMAGTTGKDKNASRYRCQELFPTVDVSLKKHDGRAEALLIAEYGRRLLSNQ